MIGRRGAPHPGPGGPIALPTCTVFAVVGQHRAAPERLLLRADDGRYYAYVNGGQPTEVEPTADWAFDSGPGAVGGRATSGFVALADR